MSPRALFSQIRTRGSRSMRRLLAAVIKRVLTVGPSERTDKSSPWDELNLTHVLSCGATIRVRSWSDWWVYNEVFVDGEYDEAINLAMRGAEPSSAILVLDLGANVGFFTARFVDICSRTYPGRRPRVVMIEGSPSIYRELIVRSNEFAQQDISLTRICGLVGARSGASEIVETPFSARNTLIPEHNVGVMDADQMRHQWVRYIDLLELVRSDERVTLLKCDVEGSEERMIESYAESLLQRTDVAVFELHNRLCDVDRCIRLLGTAGLRPLVTSAATESTSLILFARS